MITKLHRERLARCRAHVEKLSPGDTLASRDLLTVIDLVESLVGWREIMRSAPFVVCQYGKCKGKKYPTRYSGQRIVDAVLAGLPAGQYRDLEERQNEDLAEAAYSQR